MHPSMADFDAIHNIYTGRHLYQFYKSAEDFYHILIPYFQSGLEKDEACLWLVSDPMGVEEAINLCDDQIPRFWFYFASGQFQILSAENWYLADGVFDEAKAMANAQGYAMQILSQGYKRLRGAGDAGAIPKRDWPRMHAYEQKIHSWIRASPMIALCAYPIIECSLFDTKSIVTSHDDVLAGHF
ncbi:MAG: MEDS domain-containing protein [Candidatus Omnitrophica bacterium]|nr:MEDS domain-containing protein [Candidatus Omnitrophota bacterium]